jgi:hypothetical protein
MARRSPALRVGTPCPVGWAAMPGDDRVRFCGQCQQNVYNVASLTPSEVERLVREREGRVCIRLQYRADGTVITRDCWHAFRVARERVLGTALALAASAVGFWGGVGVLRRVFRRLTDVEELSPPPRAGLGRATLGELSPPPPPPPRAVSGRRRHKTVVLPPEPDTLMGVITIPE